MTFLSLHTFLSWISETKLSKLQSFLFLTRPARSTSLILQHMLQQPQLRCSCCEKISFLSRGVPKTIATENHIDCFLAFTCFFCLSKFHVQHLKSNYVHDWWYNVFECSPVFVSPFLDVYTHVNGSRGSLNTSSSWPSIPILLRMMISRSTCWTAVDSRFFLSKATRGFKGVHDLHHSSTKTGN